MFELSNFEISGVFNIASIGVVLGLKLWFELSSTFELTDFEITVV